MYSLFQYAVAATAILQAIILHQKGILMFHQGKIPITIMMHTANAHPVAPLSLTGTVGNADIPMLIRDGWARNMDKICSNQQYFFEFQAIHFHITKTGEHTPIIAEK